jgi:hypothetical protein
MQTKTHEIISTEATIRTETYCFQTGTVTRDDKLCNKNNNHRELDQARVFSATEVQLIINTLEHGVVLCKDVCFC